MHPAILSLSTAVPPHQYLQEEVAKKAVAIFGMDEDKAALTKRIYQNSAIHKRHSVIPDFNKGREEWEFWGLTIRIKSRACRSGINATRKKLQNLPKKPHGLHWSDGEGSFHITHLILVSCTGMIAPGIEYFLMHNLGLSPSVNRLGINFMGCFGAFKGLAVAKAFAQEDCRHRILLVCSELCTLHLQADQDGETIMGHSLFADGAAGAIIGKPGAGETPLWEITRTHSLGFDRSLNKMSWEASDRGFLMRLSHTVPVLIGREIKAFAAGLLKEDALTEGCDWAIHPGGKSIVQAIEKSLNLQSDQTRASWETLRNYGNMSSATFLFVLEQLSRQKNLRPWTAGLGFGPGLSAEGILLRRISDH